MKSGYQSANSASARKYARCWWVEFLVDGSSSWTLHERCIVLVFFFKIKQQINWHLLLRCHSLFVFSNVCEFDIWVFASADGSGQIRMRVALRGWNQLLGKTGVGQGGESWGRRYVYYLLSFCLWTFFSFSFCRHTTCQKLTQPPFTHFMIPLAAEVLVSQVQVTP